MDPWDNVIDRYPVGCIVCGTVRALVNYFAFIQLEEGVDGQIHDSDLSWTRRVGHPNEILRLGQEVRCKVLSVDVNRRRIALGLKQLEDDPWKEEIPRRFRPGQIVKGTVHRMAQFGVFVDLGDGLDGLLHVSEIADYRLESPDDVVRLGEEIEVKILCVDVDERKIGLSRKRAK